MKRKSCVAFVGTSLVVPALLALPAIAAEARAPYEVMSPGQVSCASWIEGRDAAGRDDVVFLTQQGVQRAEREGWVSGYLSALNIEILPNDRGAIRDLTEATDRNALMASIDDYCALNPLHSLLSATATVSLALANEWLAAHPPSPAFGEMNPRLPTAGLPPPEAPVSDDEEVLPSAAEVPLSALRPEPLPEAQPVAQPEPLPPLPGPTLAPAPAPPTNPVQAAPTPVPPAPVAPPTPQAPAVPAEPIPVPPPAAAFAPPSSPVPELRSVVAAVTGGALLQIGAYRTDALAEQAWQEFLAEHVDIVSGLATDVQAVDLGARGVWHRLRIGPFSSSEAANTTCNSLKARGADCFAVMP